MNPVTLRPQILIGLSLVLVGALYFLGNLGVLRGFNPWQVLWGAIWLGLGMMVLGPRGREVGAARLALGVGLVGLGVATLLSGMGLIDFSLGHVLSSYWPVVLIGLGALLLFRSNRARAEAAADHDRIVHDSIIGDFKLRQPAWRLRDVRATTVIGDMKIDLSKATIPDGESVLDLRAIIGDVEVAAPPGLPVALDVNGGLVSLDYFGTRHNVILRCHVETPSDYADAPRRVRVRAELAIGELSLSRARQSL